MTLGGLLSAPPAIVAAGVDVFSDALRAQGADVHDVDWRPPGFGDPADLAALALDRRRAAAHRTAAGMGERVRPDARRADRRLSVRGLGVVGGGRRADPRRR